MRLPGNPTPNLGQLLGVVLLVCSLLASKLKLSHGWDLAPKLCVQVKGLPSDSWLGNSSHRPRLRKHAIQTNNTSCHF